MTTLALPQLTGANTLTNSRMQTFRTCPRKHLYRYELGVRKSRQEDYFRLGGAFHLGLDLRAQGKTEADAIAGAVAGYDTLPGWCQSDEQVAEWMVERETVARLLSGYFWRWSDPGPNVIVPAEVIATEQVFDLPVVNPETGKASTLWRVGGKIDKIVKLSDGRLAVMEHKTTGDSIEPGSDYWTRLEIDSQISLYMYAARQMGFNVATVLYDVARKPGIRPRKITRKDYDEIASGTYCGEPLTVSPSDIHTGEVERPAMYGARLTADIAARPDFYYSRREIPRLDVDLDGFAQELWDTAATIREARNHGRHYRNSGACTGFGTCEYLSHCLVGITRERPPAGFEAINNIHPELESE